MRKLFCFTLIFALVFASASFVFAGDYEQSQIASNTAITNSYLSSWNTYITYLGSINNYVANLVNIKSDTSVISSLVRGISSYIANIDSNLTYNSKSISQIVYDSLDLKISSSYPSYPSMDYPVSNATYPFRITGWKPSSSEYRLTIQQNAFTPSSLGDWLNTLNTNLVATPLALWTPNRTYAMSSYNFEDFNFLPSGNGYSRSVMDTLTNLSNNLTLFVGRLSAYFVDDESLQAKKDNMENTQAVVGSFLTSSSSTSVGISDISNVSNGLSNLQNGFAGSASASKPFEVLDSGSDAWVWFSVDTFNSLDTVSPTGNGGRLMTLASDTPFLDQYLSDVLGGL